MLGISLLYQMVGANDGGTAASQCSDIGFMPHNMYVTYAKDIEGDLVDIHTFNKIFTFQIDRPKEQNDGMVQSKFFNEKSAGEGFLFRLRAELSASYSDQVQQGMRVSLIDDSNGFILVDGSSIDDNEGVVHLDYHKMEHNKTYYVKYEFFDKQLTMNNEINEVSFSMTNTQCKLPYVSQELIIQDKKLVKTRIAKYNNQPEKNSLPITNFKCNFDGFNNTQDGNFGEEGIFCERTTYTYPNKQTPQDLVKLYEHTFNVRGNNNELVTYWYEMLIGYNFMVGSGIKVLLARTDVDVSLTDSDPFACLYDRSCVLASISNKNQLKIDVILTSGEYTLTFFDQQNADVRKYLADEGGLQQIPFTFKLTSYPVIQNEERVNCPYMFLDRDFIQHKFIDGMQGQRFRYSDKVILNVFNLTQTIFIKPEVDSILKVQAKEAFGVNAAIVLCTGDDCVTNSMQIGTSELLLTPVSKGVEYTVELGYANSIITLSNFFQCPHINYEITMIPQKEAIEIVKESQCTHQTELDSDEQLNTIVNALIDNKEGYLFQNYKQIFTYNVDQKSSIQKTQNYEIVSKKFVASTKMQLFVEVFYDPYLYDLEIFLQSDDADLVRSHIYKAMPNVDWSKYKGAKQIFVEVEPGEYEIKIMQKIPGISSSLTKYQVQCVSFQLRLIFHESIDRQFLMPNSLNYYGMLGPNGNTFGQMVYFCSNCVLENQQYQYIEFFLKEDNNLAVNFDAVIESGIDNVVLTLEEIKADQLSISDDKSKLREKGKQKGVKKITKQGNNGNENEESLSQENLSSSTYYRIVLNNKDFQTTQSVEFTLRVDVQEKVYAASTQKFVEILPTKIDDIQRFKIKTEGLKESEFYIGTKFMLQYINEYALHPFVPKSNKVYQAMYSKSSDQNDQFMLALPFQITEEESQIYAQVAEYTGVASLSISIIRDSEDNGEEFEVKSIPGKYHSYLRPITLTRGKYYLVVEPETTFPYESDSIIRFGLDFVYSKETLTNKDQEFIIDSMELCGLSGFPYSLNSPQYMHPLSGQSVQFLEDYKIDEVLLGASIDFELHERSLVTFYMQLPKEMNAFAEITKTKGTNKIKLSTKDINKKSDNFLRQKDLDHVSIIEVREFLNAGLYHIKVFASELEEQSYFAMSRCQSFKVGVSIVPTKVAQHKVTERCQTTSQLGSKMVFDQLTRGSLMYDIGDNIIDTTHIVLDSQGEGPFLFYFNLNYDISLEGPLAVTLNKYSMDSLIFEEVQIFEVQDSQSQILAIVEEGTYVIGVTSLSTTSNKYDTRGLGKQDKRNELKLLNSPCLKAQYSYFVVSMTKFDSQLIALSFADLLYNIFSGDMFKDLNKDSTKYDQQVRDDFKEVNYLKCRYDDLPSLIPSSEAGFDKTFALKISKKNFEVIDIVSEENQLLRVFVNAKNPKNNVNVFLYQNGQMNNLLAYTENSKFNKNFLTTLKAQKKAYKLKIVFDSLDESDECPLFDLRIAMKPIDNLVDENLVCTALNTPPERIAIEKSNFDIDQEFAFSGSFVKKHSNDKGFSYDIDITVPNHNYYFDIEARFDFLTTNIDMFLIGRDEKVASKVVLLGQSQFVNEEGLGDSGRDLATTKSIKKIVKRLRVNNIEDQLSEGQTIKNTYRLKLKFSKQTQSLLEILTSKNLLTSQNEVCFPFDLSIRATEIKPEQQGKVEYRNELIRIDWSTKLSTEQFDPRQKLSAFLQFRNSMKDDYKTLKFTQFTYLIKEDAPNQYINRIYPMTTRMSSIDKSSLVITFKHDTLERGKCYNLKIDQELLGFAYEEQLFNNQTKICTTNCLCNPQGTKKCDEKLGVCECHFPYVGDDCSECGFGYVLNEATKECVPFSKCKENGGEEDCNGHGTCYENEQTGIAQCDCDEGFTNDGNDMCGTCTDPLFDYPDCALRFWVIEHSSFNCQDLKHTMPRYLYQNGTQSNETYQNQEGLVYWSGTYRLIADKLRKKSVHFFYVEQNSVLRLFFDTMESGVKVKYTLLDDNKKIILTTAKDEPYIKEDTLIHLLPQTEKHNAKENPFVLVFEYEYTKEAQEPEACPLIDLYMIVQPLNLIQSHLQCSNEEIENSKKMKQFSWQFGSNSQHFTERFSLTSDQKVGDQGSYFEEENENFYIMKYQLNIQRSRNAISVMASYNFESVSLAMTLVDKKTNNIIAVEKIGSLEDINTDNDEITMDNDMISFIELPSIDEGMYELQILVMKSLFLPTVQYKTCLNFDLTLEYVSRNQNMEDNPQSYEVIRVFPSQIKSVNMQKGGRMEVKFNQALDIDAMISNQQDLKQICYLENTAEKNTVIYPYKVINQPEDTLSLYFNFQNVKIPQNTRNYKMRCTTQFNVGKELIQPLAIETSYSFPSNTTTFAYVVCNPWAFPKIEDNKCSCSKPYNGPLCESCDAGYIESKDQKTGKHTICVLDMGRCSKETCNNHGNCLKNPNQAKDGQDFICKCESKYDGQFCEKCLNHKFAYPDCIESQLADIYDTKLDKEYLQRRQYSLDGYQKNMDDKDKILNPKQQCSWANFPTDLDRVEYMNALGGQFHVADYYTIHHDQDNIIKFTPKNQGVVKLFVQQPEQSDVVINDELFDFEIGIYDLNKDKFLVSSMNHHLNFGNNNLDGKLEYASIQFQIPFEYIDQTLYIMFRAVNYSISVDEELNSCEEVYLEIEYRDTPRECQYAKTAQSTGNVIKVSENEPYKMRNENQVYSVYNNQKQFFYYQDFYLNSDSDADIDYIFEVNIEQKFLEKNQIDFLIEVLESDVDYNDFNNKYSQQADKPECEDICLTSGQKAFNEFHNAVTITSRTYFRFWLFQFETDGTCGNFQLFIDIRPATQNTKDQSLINLKCEDQDLPKTLNTNRYLGARNAQKQLSFHYFEKFRIDNLVNSTTHRIMFELQEPTLVRFVAPVHKHVEFDMEIRQLTEGKKNKKLISSAARGFEDSVFAQLDAGKYYLKILFVTEEFFMNKPCQSIELGMAMMPIVEAKRLNLELNNQKETPAYTLETVMNTSSNLINVLKLGGIKSFEMDNVQHNSKYESYVELYSIKLKLPDKTNLGIILIVQSDFLFNDVNFVLTNLQTKNIYHNIRRENLNKLVLDSVPGGEYELLVYAHQCLTNMGSGYLQTLNIKYQLDFNFVRWATDSLYTPQYLSFDLGNKKIKGKMHNFDENEFKCYSQYEILPDDLNSIVIGSIDISSNYMIPIFEEYIHHMTYTPPQNVDILRVIVDRPNTKISLYKDNVESEPITSSFSYNYGQGAVLVVRGLKSGSKYIIAYTFNLIENFEDFEKEACQYFKVSIISSSDKDQCLKESVSTDKLAHTELTQITKQLLIDIPLAKGYNVLRLNVVDETIDLEISVDYSNQFYVPDFRLHKKDQGDAVVNKEDVQKEIISQIKPNEIEISIKKFIKYKFINLKKDSYALLIVQNKPKNCQTKLSIEFNSYKPLSQQTILDQEIFGQLKVYTGLTEIHDKARFVDTLPISLNTYKYMKEESYLLISEYVQYTNDQDKNKISFTIEKDETIVKFYVETDELTIKMRDKTLGVDLQTWKTGTVTATLGRGEYEIQLEFFTDYSKRKADITNQYLHYTMMISEKQIYQEKYQKAQGVALTSCDKSTNFPLALNKKVDDAINELESVYDYPHLRISSETMSSKFIVDTYSFRVNETSRFYMHVGMHMLNHQVVLALSDLRSFGNSYGAKQQFNLNVLDVILSAGDYALIIDQPSMKYSESLNYCGIFSFGAKITPLSQMNDQKGGTAQNKCEIKEVLPYKIYNSEQNTKNGFEYFINSEGTFFRRFENILFKKSRASQTMPEYDRIQFQPREDGLVSFLFQYKQKSSSLIVKLYDGFAYTLVGEPLIHKLYETSNNVIEESITFKIQKDHEYTLIVYYHGEMTFNQDGREQCEYYNIAIAINHLSYLKNDMKCLDSKQLFKSFVGQLPNSITDKDFQGKNEYKFSEFLELQYPKDFDTLSSADDRQLLVKGIDINLSSKFNIESNIKFDFPDSLFQLSLYDKVSVQDIEGDSQLEEVGMNLPLQSIQGNVYEETHIRLYRAKNLAPRKNYIFAIAEDESRVIFDYVQENDKVKQNLCLYIHFGMVLTKQQTAAQLSTTAPYIISVYPKQPSKLPMAVDKVSKELRVSLEFSQPIFLKKTQAMEGKDQSATKARLAEIVTLQAFHPQTGELLYSKMPFKIFKEKELNRENSTKQSWSFIFNIQDEQKNKDFRGTLKFAVNTKELMNSQSKEFELKEGVTMPTFMFYTHQTDATKKKEAEDFKSQIQKEKIAEQKQVKVESQPDVKCLCVHGTCPKGSKYCDKCHAGWEGKLCDIKISSENINNDDDFEKSSNRLNRQKAGKSSYISKDERKQSDSKAVQEDNSWFYRMSGNPPKETSSFVQSKDTTKKQQTSILSYIGNLVYQFIVTFLFILTCGLGIYAFVNRDKVKEHLKNYIPVSLQDKQDDDDSMPKKAMELSDLRPTQSKAKSAGGSKGYQNVLMDEDDDDEDDDTKKFKSELMLYADASEQDQALMMKSASPDQKLRKGFDLEQPQHVNENEAVNEINTALEELGNDSDSDDENELRRFF